MFLGANGELSTLINAVRVEQEGGIAVFNFTVEGNHNYFILAKEYEYGQTCVLVHNASCSIKQRLKDAELPTRGKIRYVPPKGYNPKTPLPRGPNGGYIDRFGNEWVKGPSRTLDQPFEWDVQLPKNGVNEIFKSFARPPQFAHVNVSLDGRITH